MKREPWYSVGQRVAVTTDFRSDGDHVRHLPDRQTQQGTVERVGIMTRVLLDACTPTNDPIRIWRYDFEVYAIKGDE